MQSTLHFVYIVRCADGTLYTGYARDPHAREQAHNSGRGARYTAGRRPVSLVYSEAFKSLGEALKREHQLKRWRRKNKEALVAAAREAVKPPLTETAEASATRAITWTRTTRGGFLRSS